VCPSMAGTKLQVVICRIYYLRHILIVIFSYDHEELKNVVQKKPE
jgi:hypothetical protein